MIQAAPMNDVIMNKQLNPSASMFGLLFPVLRDLKFSNQESFRTLKYSFGVLDYSGRKFSNLESFRALTFS
jgi:hypothetical protein